MVIKVHKGHQPVKKYVFGKRAASDAKNAAAAPVAAPAAGDFTAPMLPPAYDPNVPPNLPFLRFESIAGKGGMAVVWKAHHLELDIPVAVKVMNPEFATSGQDVRQFMQEVRAMTDLHHPNIIQGYGADCIDGRYYFIMDYVDGYTFGSLLQRKGRVQEIDALVIGEAVATALQYAWNTFKIVHCDIKPENVMVNRDGTVKLADLGLCQTQNAICHASEDAEETVVGTPAYISPEQVYGDEPLDCRADIYCLGATLYHLVTGRVLYPGIDTDDILRAHVDPEQTAPDARTLAPRISYGFVNMLAKMLVKDKGLRYQTWEDVIEDAMLLEMGGVPKPPPTDAVSSMRIGS